MTGFDPDNPATLRPWLTEHVCRYWLACVHDPAGGFFESRDALGSAVANQRRSTLAQVARAAGVSVATASRALNGDDGPLRAGPAARANKIRQMAQKLGYRPDWRARSSPRRSRAR